MKVELLRYHEEFWLEMALQCLGQLSQRFVLRLFREKHGHMLISGYVIRLEEYLDSFQVSRDALGLWLVLL